ncbi:MAG: restriction endonuclease [Candidatus Dadabacteria bacterium]|nr:restriction endonuclease [Candidatus Dadabacteria bacterium]MYC40148.1 restriction endonuclease [Candidatus Dadabacteria bacterium]
MKLAFTYGKHYNASVEWEQRGLRKWLTGIFEASTINITRGCTPHIREHVETEFLNEGWALGVKLNQDYGLEVTAEKEGLAFQLQTGNMSRAPYDLLKLQFLFQNGRIQAAALALPTKEAAREIGDNIANAERVIRELELFDRVITVPIFIIAFE